MTRTQIWHSTRYDLYPTSTITKGFQNLLHVYLDKNSGKIIDIGCGQSPFILSMIENDFSFLAIDEEPYAIKYLKKRVVDIDEKHLKKIRFANDSFEDIIFDEPKFDGVVLCNFIHFLTKAEGRSHVKFIRSISNIGAIWYIKVHSKKHPHLGSEGNYFKSFYDRDDINSLFPEEDFEQLHFAETEHLIAEEEKRFMRLHAQRYYGTGKEELVEKHIKDNERSASIEIVLRQLK